GDATSLAHGWASGATADLSSYVLGVLPATPGFRTWSVRPHPASLGWAEGQVPTPHGAIGVRWAQDRPAGRFSLQVVTPAGTRGVVSVPVIRPGSVLTVRSSGGARSGSVRKTIAAPRGATDVAVSVVGGPTYDFSVAPG
ncbi:MAG TPA: alpha-L-rhamnosidase C-terminal domain-containing protein, partial [Acidimicrobiales bacterium]|nr:alpha-L-rhamnosidase C-terminal domain-containing protein [Acidimicrobiales bacterium]